MKNMDNFNYACCATTKSTLFTVRKDKLNTKGGHWIVHEECIVHTAVRQKAHLGPK